MVYKRSLVAVIWNIVGIIFGVILAFIFLGFFFDTKIAFIVAGILLIVLLVSTIRDVRMKLVVEENQLDIFIGKKEYHYELDKISMTAESRNNDSFTLYITDANGVRETFDLSLLGYTKYHQLLDDLAITGDKSSVTKLEVSKK